MRLVVDPDALRAASDRVAHDAWTVRLATDDVARILAGTRDRLGAASIACTDGLAPLLDAAHRVADSETRLAEALATLAVSYRHVDGQGDGRCRSAAGWC